MSSCYRSVAVHRWICRKQSPAVVRMGKGNTRSTHLPLRSNGGTQSSTYTRLRDCFSQLAPVRCGGGAPHRTTVAGYQTSNSPSSDQTGFAFLNHRFAWHPSTAIGTAPHTDCICSHTILPMSRGTVFQSASFEIVRMNSSCMNAFTM